MKKVKKTRYGAKKIMSPKLVVQPTLNDTRSNFITGC